MKVLAVDTSGTSLSLALCEDDKLVAEFNLQQGYNHSVTQMPLLEHMLSVCGVTAGDIDLFTCSIGPGSFTGIRIGVSSVKAMAYALGRPTIGVSSLEALMFPFINLESALICPAIDARRGRVFAGLWRVENGRLSEVIPAANVLAVDLASQIVDLTVACDIRFAGDGQSAVIEAVHELLPGNRNNSGLMIASDGSGRCIRAYAVAQIGLHNYLQGADSQPQTLMPEYLSPSQAERMRDAK